jgi:hypothetical protein
MRIFNSIGNCAPLQVSKIVSEANLCFAERKILPLFYLSLQTLSGKMWRSLIIGKEENTYATENI